MSDFKHAEFIITSFESRALTPALVSYSAEAFFPQGYEQILKQTDRTRKIINKNSDFILPFMCKSVVICAFLILILILITCKILYSRANQKRLNIQQREREGM